MATKNEELSKKWNDFFASVANGGQTHSYPFVSCGMSGEVYKLNKEFIDTAAKRFNFKLVCDYRNNSYHFNQTKNGFLCFT